MNCRHSPAGSGYPNSGLLRQNADTSGRSAPRPQPYPLYQGQGPSSQQQVFWLLEVVAPFIYVNLICFKNETHSLD
jgi:hypothetical protein